MFWAILISIMAFFAYFLPAFVAYGRNHNNAAAILVLDFFLGWSFVGWVIALVWALTDNVKNKS
jgi:hypothetical protein